ncbi:MAG: hypothetical protein QM526_00940 [Alphaproteobacteria bacterium]|nr:hypothetical protein [Alphaproteobacteria bacterium]
MNKHSLLIKNVLNTPLRKFPWRVKRNAYRVYIAECMLQQTQTNRAVPYFTSFIKKYPTLKSLSKASRKNVLFLWQGLGYNRRALFLLHNAKESKPTYTLPKEYSDLCALQGVGSYTAHAIRIFAYNMWDVCIETNIRTVLVHYCFKNKKSVSDAILITTLQKIISLVKKKKITAYQFYSKIMDHGAQLKKQHLSYNTTNPSYKKASTFVGSVREARGKIIAYITSAHEPVSYTILQKKIQHKKLLQALLDLERNGMIKKKKGGFIV